MLQHSVQLQTAGFQIIFQNLLATILFRQEDRPDNIEKGFKNLHKAKLRKLNYLQASCIHN